jgi:hypothetical protein
MRKSCLSMPPQCFATLMNFRTPCRIPALQSGEGSKVNAIVGCPSLRRRCPSVFDARQNMSEFAGFRWCERGFKSPPLAPIALGIGLMLCV